VIPIRIDDATPPLFLEDKKYLDFRDWSDPNKFRSSFDDMVRQFGWINSVRCKRTGMRFVRVPAGVFLYGPGKTKVHLDEYWIGKYVMRLAEMMPALQKTDPRGVPAIRSFPHLQNQLEAGKLDYPASYVNIAWAIGVGKSFGYRLPTPQEWEKAARGVDGRLYPWGDDWDPARCNCCKSIDDTNVMPVDAYEEGDSPYTCRQMAGNVEEITSQISRENIETGELTYIAKGGAYWHPLPEHFLASAEHGASDVGTYPSYGYRFVVDTVDGDSFE